MAKTKGIEIDENLVKRLVQNILPVPSVSVKERNADARFFPLSGIPWAIDVTVGGVVTRVASGTTTTKFDKVFCLQVVTRVHDDAHEPLEVASEIL